MRYTIEEVAVKAGVSKATVSRVMNGTATVSRETKTKVEAAIKKLNYEPNLNARKLAGGKGGSIALVLEESTDQFFSNPFWKLVVDGFITYAASHNQHPVLFFHSSQETDRELASALIRGSYDAIAIFGWHHDINVIEKLLPKDIRVVFGGRQGESARFTHVGVDNVVGGEMATQHLIDQGCRNIVHITGDLTVESGRERLQGYRNAHKRAGLKLKEGNIVEGDYSTARAEKVLLKYLEKRDDLDGIFAGNDLSGIGAISVLKEKGFSIPTDVKVIGFDGTDLAKTNSPSLSTVAQPSYDLGSEVARQLILPASEKLVNVNLPLELIVRESSRK
ncbi:MAG: LacI family DNA-binding transcriptional regulator [Actinomycetes bacterium]